jgi:class 3 adenylate cyclase
MTPCWISVSFTLVPLTRLRLLPALFGLLSGASLAALPMGGIAKNGIADFSAKPFEASSALDGEWKIVPYRFLMPAEIVAVQQTAATILVPGAWRDRRPDLFESNQGYATYFLTVRLHRADIGRMLALRLPQISTAYRLFIDGTEYAAVGKIATERPSSQPEYRRLVIPFVPSQSQVQLVLQVSNYEEANVSGVWKNLEIGSYEAVRSRRETALAYDLLTLGIFFVFGFYHIALFLLRREDKSTFAFGVFCLFVGLRTAVTGERVLPATSLLSFIAEVRMEYCTIYAATAAFNWFVRSLFPRDYPARVFYAIAALCAIPLLFTLVTDTLVFAALLPWFQMFILLNGAWLLYVVARAIYYRRPGARVLVGGFLFLLATVINDIVANRSGEGSFHLPLGLTVFIFSQSFNISLLFSRAFRETRALSSKLQQTNETFRKFVPEDALRLLRKDDIAALTLGEQTLHEFSVLFADVRNFTTISEKMTPEESFRFLNSYLQQVGPVVRHHGGFIDKYLGDGIMALFPGSADQALDAAVHMQRSVQQYNDLRQRAGYDPIAVGIGLHYGPVMLGTVGEAERIEVTAISDSVNLAYRLQELSRNMGAPIIISEMLFQHLSSPHDLNYRMLGQVRLKGKQTTVTVFEILSGRSAEQAEALELSKGIFERGILHYIEGNYARAQELFGKALEICREDQVANLYFERCRLLAHQPDKSSLALADSILV